jgi:hypothetical protein
MKEIGPAEQVQAHLDYRESLLRSKLKRLQAVSPNAQGFFSELAVKIEVDNIQGRLDELALLRRVFCHPQTVKAAA